MTRKDPPHVPVPGREAAGAAPGVFRALHSSGCFIMPNPWDRGSALYLHHLGFRALATTSAGFSFSRGLPDSMSALAVDDVLDHAGEIVAATPLPVNADFQSGYAADPEGVAENVVKCVRTGVAGLSIEDATGESTSPLYSREESVERLRAARAAIDGTGIPVVLTARCEAWLVGDRDPLRTALERLTAYADAGADCLFAPGVRDPGMIHAIVKAVAPKPVNVIVSSPAPGLSLAEIEDLGVRRISVGSALARVAWGAFIRASESIAKTGSFDLLQDATGFTFLNELFTQR